MQDIVVFGGSSHPKLALAISLNLQTQLCAVSIQHFLNDCLGVQLQAECRSRDVFLIQSLVPPVQENLVELLFMIGAAKNSSAGQITVVLPYYSYARSDKQDTPRTCIAGRLVADLLVAAGADRILAMTFHSPQVQGFFSIPVYHLNVLPELVTHFRKRDLSNSVVISPDFGSAKQAETLARMLELPVAVGSKRRLRDSRVSISTILGDVAGRDAIVLDDEIVKGLTLFELIDRLREQRVKSVRIACTHGLFLDDTLSRLSSYPDVIEIVSTDTVPFETGRNESKLSVLTVAPIFAQAIRKIRSGEAVGPSWM